MLARGVQTRCEDLVSEHARAMDAWSELERGLNVVRALARLCRDTVSLQGVYREQLTPLLRAELGLLTLSSSELIHTFTLILLILFVEI